MGTDFHFTYLMVTVMKNLLVILAALVTLQAFAMKHDLGSNSIFSERAVGERIAPVGRVVLATEVVDEGPKEPRTGEEVFSMACGTCHGSGMMGAPKLGEWADRKSKGIATLLEHAKNGFNAMPAMGACSDCSDQEMTAAIEYMIQ